MTVLGKILKEARSKKGVNLDKLSENLKISIYYLKAIEDGNFKKTPGDPYTLSFVKSYGKFFELDLDLLTKIYKDETNLIKKNSLDLPRVYNYVHYNYIKYTFASLLCVFFAFGFYNFFLSKTYINNDYAIVTEPDANIIALIEEDQLKRDLKILQEENKKNFSAVNENINIEEKTEEEIITNDPRQAVAAVDINHDSQNTKDIVLKILGDTWIQIKNKDEQIIISKLMKENEKYFLQSEDIYYITTGNAGNIQLLIDNKSYGKLGKKGEILNSYELNELFKN